LGALISMLPLKLPTRMASALGWIFAAVLAGGLVVVRQSALSKIAAEWVIALLFACLMYLLLHQTGKASAGIYRTVSSFLSRISYTLYLVHVPMTVFLCAWVDRPWHHWTKTPLHLTIVLALAGVVVAYAWVFYLLFEANTGRVRSLLLHPRVGVSHAPAA
jgi:peptidoglycan/LPS O-acetylase OafA/YrhL